MHTNTCNNISVASDDVLKTKEWLTVEEVAVLAGIGSNAIYRHIKKGNLQAHASPGNSKTVLKRSDVEVWLQPKPINPRIRKGKRDEPTARKKAS